MLTKRFEGWKSSALCSVALLGSLAASGCMQARDPINRVQPDYLDKNDFIPNQYKALSKKDATPELVTPQMLAKEPVFYTQTTLIAKPTSTGFTGLTSYSESDKIRWQVTENALIARQAWEYIKNAPGGSAGIGQNVQTGDVVAVFRITSHFDIRHEYNSTTGENLNVIGENTADRPWYQRQYMRVDWSQNLITGYNSVFAEQEWEGTLQAEPVPVFVNTPNDPNAPVFAYSGSEKDGTRRLDYFDVVNQAVLHPETTMYSYSDHPGDTTTYPAIPLCYMGEGEMDCAPAQVTLRVSFRRVDHTRDYEPASLSENLTDASGSQQNIPHLNMERFGFFDVSRVGWDPAQHNVLDTQRMHMAARHNLWVHHHALVYGDANGQGCNFDTDCATDAKGAATGRVCKIGEQAFDATHRGACAALAYHHVPNELGCQSDDDCRQWGDTNGVSHTATCDVATHTCGEHYVRCSSDQDCASISALSTCDRAIAYTRADNRGLCLMPFSWRQVRPIAYHESNNYPAGMQPVTEAIVREWNGAFVEAVTSARRHECEISKGVDPATTDAASNPCNDPKVLGTDPTFGADAQFVFVGCHSPVWGTAAGAGQHTEAEVDATHKAGWDLPSCGPQGTEARLGDLRYNMIGAITDQDSQGYWGLANIAADPDTGEMIAGRGAVWQTITDYYAHTLITYVKLLNGELDPGAVTNGDDLIYAMKQLGEGKMPSRQILDHPIVERGLEKAVKGASKGIERLKLPNAGWFKPEGKQTLRGQNGKPGALTLGLNRLLDGRLLGDGNDLGNARLNSLAGSSLEKRLMNVDQARLAPTANLDLTGTQPGTIEAASPMRRQSATVRHMIERAKARVAAFQCGKEAAFNDDLLLGLAVRLAQGAPIKANDPDDGPVAFGRDWDFQLPGGGVDYDLMAQYAAQFIHHGVLAHELGHSLGQRHNFTASADAINYFDNYWVHRLKGHPKGLRPRYEYLADPADGKYYSDEEIAGRVDEWSYSSVMDYKGLNEDAHGIGRYDVAFIKNGYVNMVEAFKHVADTDAALSYSFNTAGSGISTPLDLTGWAKGGALKSMHYSMIPTIFGTRPDGTPDIQKDNRYDVFLNETYAAGLPGWGAPSYSNVTTDGHVLVPYRFDSDERAGLVWQDQRYDAGPDQYESLHYVASHLIDYYFINSYARLRTGFSTGKYVARIWGRYLEQFRQTTQLLAFDLINWQDFFATSPGWDAYVNDPNVLGGYINQTAMNMAVDTMVGILTIPEIGAHVRSNNFDGSKLYTVDMIGVSNTFDVPINDGRAFESNWRNDVGFWWYDMLDRAGSYYDKVMMLQALTDPQLLLLQRDTPSDIRLFQLSFYTMYPDQMMRLFGAMLSEDFDDFAPIVSTTDQTIARTHVSTLNAPDAERGRTIDAKHTAIDPQTHFTIQLWSAVQTVAQFPATYDQRYMDFARLWIDGSAESIDVKDPDVNTVTFTDPFSHQTYRALHFDCKSGPGAGVGCSNAVHPGGGANEAGVAARMILHAQDLEAVRQQKIAANDTSGAAELELQLTKYLDLLNVMRDLTKAFGSGTSQLP